MMPHVQGFSNPQPPLSQDAVRELLDVVARRKWVIIQALFYFTVVGVVAAALSPPVYRTVSKLLVEPQSTIVVSQIDTRSSISPLLSMRQQRNMNTQLAILQSVEFRRRVQERIAKDHPESAGASVSLSFAQPDSTTIISVAAEGTNPAAAADWANTAASEYVNLTAESNTAAITKTRKYLESAAAAAKADLAAAEASLMRFTRRTEMNENSEISSIRLKDAIDQQSRAREVRSELQALDARIDGIHTRLQSEPERIEETREEANPDYDALRKRISERRAAKVVALGTFHPESPDIRSLNEEIADLERELAAIPVTNIIKSMRPNPTRATLLAQLKDVELEREAKRALSRSLGESGELKSDRISQFAPWQVELAQLQRERGLSERTYMDYSEKLRDLNVRERSIAATASVMEEAGTPKSPVRPNKLQQVLMAMVIGLALGLGCAYLQEILDDRVNTSEDVDRLTALPTLGVVPTVGDGKEPLLFAHNAFSTLTESYRALRTALQYSAIEQPVRTLLLTSAHPREGKSTTSCNLAIAMALQGKRVILVDTDMRHPSIHRAFRLEVEPGLSNVLAGELTLDEALRATSVEGLQVLTCGPLPPNPAEILNSQAMRDLLADLKSRADLVLLDTPPVLPVTDGQVLAGHVDSVVLVVEAGRTRKSDVKHAFTLLKPSRARILGVVLNKIDQTSKGYYYYHYYYRGGYGKYQGYGDRGGAPSLGSGRRPVPAEALSDRPNGAPAAPANGTSAAESGPAVAVRDPDGDWE